MHSKSSSVATLAAAFRNKNPLLNANSALQLKGEGSGGSLLIAAAVALALGVNAAKASDLPTRPSEIRPQLPGAGTSEARAENILSFDLPAQPLVDSLKALSSQTNLNVFFEPKLVSGLQAPAIRARASMEEALKRLLEGSGLTFRHVDEKTIAVVVSDAATVSSSVPGSGKFAAVSPVDGVPLQAAYANTPATRSFWQRLAQASENPSSASSVPEPSSPEQSAKLEEVVVTASRRRQTLEEVPYSITAISADQLSNTGVTDIASLASQVPGLSMYNLGARKSSSVFPIIRGLNASALSNNFRTLNQAPVGTYLGNSPIEGYFQLDDVQRVEVLRGPQGTLYGAGALGGALRIIPNAPELNTFSGSVELGGGSRAHASDASYTTTGMVNVPLGETLAFRASGKYAFDPGFIDVYGLVKHTGSPLSGLPVLADPTDTINSPAIYSGKNDWNHQNAFTGRSSLLWKPADPFSAELAFTYSNVNGNAAPVTNSLFTGGPYAGDPRITFPRGGDYQYFTALEEPWSRRTTLASVDLSYDAGFATLSSTSSYQTTSGAQISGSPYGILTLAGFVGYYAGNPINPRFMYNQQFADRAHTFTQEVRLVSNPGPDKLFDYVVGVFYEDQTREGSWDITDPGTPERSVAQGCTAPYSNGGLFPNCLVVAGPGDSLFYQNDTQNFQDKSEFAELTWHFVQHGQIAFGGRHFQQSFTDSQSYLLYSFGLLLPAHANSTPASKNTWKINPSYEYAPGQHVYALWSQGFRRGGANAIPISPPFPLGEKDPSLLSYGPDSTNNYEVGLKGRFAKGLTYAFDVFDIKWDNPQVAGSTPSGNIAVWNAKKAESKGAELDLSTPLLLPGLSLTVGGAYADAKFTEDYLIPADAFGDISAKAGQQLPGSAKVSAAATLNYARSLAPGYDLAVSLNDTYRGPMVLSSFAILGNPPTPVPGMDIANLSASVSHQSWRLGAYVTNLADKRVILTSPGQLGQINNLQSASFINPPREIAVRLNYSF